ncbi:MAG: flavodoxin family protein [Smithella sp.]
MKIIGLNGSPRRKNSRTGQLVNKVLESAAAKGARTEFLDIMKLKIKPCTACDKCHKTGYCVQKDDFNQTYEKIMSADGLVLGSPVYIYQVTAQLKNWIDRLANTIHCLRFLDKYGAVVVTAGGSGEKETADYMEKILQYAGMQTAGRLACLIDIDGLLEDDSPLLNEANNLGHSLYCAIRKNKYLPVRSKKSNSAKSTSGALCLNGKKSGAGNIITGKKKAGFKTITFQPRFFISRKTTSAISHIFGHYFL